MDMIKCVGLRSNNQIVSQQSCSNRHTNKYNSDSRMMNKNMEQHFSDVISTDETLANLKIQISKVKLDRNSSCLEVFWMCFDGAESDEQTKKL
ncbi:unnamed protein product [Caenorhabditis angaria]|uniref:Uncharacterized protein n=1 Tax=Caenorhabditis angaria TaxID=860376 RepID=A0A9P1IL58_9PELO|nr:unnamed protein product [Caenorhabditis angaria]